jgi:CPA1 family monovalent cation:H+ antiporter
MHDAEIILGLLAAVAVLAVIARAINIPYPILLVVGGLALGFVPGLPRIELSPDIIFLLFLPPLLYLSAWTTSWRDFRANRRPIGLLAIGLVLFTTVAVAVVAHMAIPDMPWPVAFVLGAIVSPTDAIAATTIAQRLGVPRRLVTVIEGESMVNDATGIVAYRFAVAAVVSGTFSLWSAGWHFVVLGAGGVAVGLSVGWVSRFLLRWQTDVSVEIVLSFVPAFAAYLLAETVHVSGVLAVVTAGIFVSWWSSALLTPEVRLRATSVWLTVGFLLNGLAFILIGLQLRAILHALTGWSTASLIGYGALVSAAVILTRILWVFPGAYVPRLLFPRLRANDPYPPWQMVAALAWCGMRGVVSLAAALALPLTTASGAAFPARDLVIFLTFCVILATLVVQGLTLSPLIRLLDLHDDGQTEHEVAKAQLRSAEAALARIEELLDEDWAPPEKLERLRAEYAYRIERLTASHGDAARRAEYDGISAGYQRLRRELFATERRTVIRLRDDGVINDEVLHRLERTLDLEEARLDA